MTRGTTGRNAGAGGTVPVIDGTVYYFALVGGNGYVVGDPLKAKVKVRRD